MESITDQEYAKLLAQCRKAGAEAGVNGAAWWAQDAIGGRSRGDPRPIAERVLKGIEDGDLEILDSLPWLDLSGQWADGATAEGVLYDANVEAELEPEEEDELVEAYRAACDEALENEIARLCREYLEEA